MQIKFEAKSALIFYFWIFASSVVYCIIHGKPIEKREEIMSKIFGNFGKSDCVSDEPESLEDVPESSLFGIFMDFEKDPEVKIVSKVLVAFLFIVVELVGMVLTVVLIPVFVILLLVSGIYTVGEKMFGGFCGKDF